MKLVMNLKTWYQIVNPPQTNLQIQRNHNQNIRRCYLFIYLFIGRDWQADSKINTDIWRTYNSQGNPGEKQTWRIYTTRYQD